MPRVKKDDDAYWSTTMRFGSEACKDLRSRTSCWMPDRRRQMAISIAKVCPGQWYTSVRKRLWTCEGKYSSASSGSFFVAKNIPRFIIRSLDYELDEWDAGDDIPELRDSTYDVREAHAAVECSIGSCCDCTHAHKRQKILLKPLAVDSLELWVREFHGTVVRSVFYDAIKIEPALFRKWLLTVLSHGYPIFVKILSFCGFAIYDGDMKSEKIIWCSLVHFWTSGFKSRISTWIWTWSSSSSRDSGLEFPR